MVLLFIFVCESVDNLGIFDDMKQNNTKTLETLRLKLFHHKGIYPNINFLLKIKTMLTLFQPSSTESNTDTSLQIELQHHTKFAANQTQYLVFANKPITNLETSKLLSRSPEGWNEVYPY